MMRTGSNLLFVGCAISILLAASASPLVKRDLRSGDEMMESKSKRPFCNAFTGCGKKRSDDGVPPLSGVADVEGLQGMQMELDPSVEKLARDILAEAKLWEAMQARRRFDERLPLFLRKRRSLAQGTAWASGSHSAKGQATQR